MTTPKLLACLASVMLLLNACGTLPRQAATKPNPAVLSCTQYYRGLTGIIEKHHVTDAQTTPVKGYPYLHVNRFLTDLIPYLEHKDKFKLWLNLARRLALQTHAIEIKNLPTEAAAQLESITPEHLRNEQPASVLQSCSKTLLEHTLASPATYQHIVRNANVPDDYHTWKRIVGLYPLVSLPVALGINRWHKKSSAALHTPVTQLPIKGRLTRYIADTQSKYASFDEIKSALLASRQNAMHIPLPDSDTLQRLFATFLPILEVDTVLDDDKIGAPRWRDDNRYAVIDSARPTVYTLISHAFFNGEILLQLNYIVWFPSRPCTSSLDYLCGPIDGINWRVTLGSNGEPLIYDTIHNCGCYHTFFPTAYLRPTPPPPITVDSRVSLEERAFSPVEVPRITPLQRLILRIQQRTHYIESIYVENDAEPPPMTVMAWEDYHVLRSLPFNGPTATQRHKSLFGKNAIIAGTWRKERWFFWPLGVTSAGAMRQWGNHATAFIGRRHFDDPNLFDKSFDPLLK